MINTKQLLKAVICIGVSASGKSTWAKEQCKEFGWIQIERDTYREMLLCTKFQAPKSNEPYICSGNIWKYWKFNSSNEDFITDEVNAEIARAHIHDLNIVISDTNLHVGRRLALKYKLEKLNYEVEFKVFGQDLSLDELWKRDTYRKNSVGHSTIASQYKKFREEFPKYQLKDATGKPEAVIFDVDGTLANISDRSPFDWMRVGEDTPNELLFISMIAYFQSGYHIIIMSGRDEVCRDITRSWIVENAIKFGCNCNFKFDLHMRKQDDQRKDTIVKAELFMNHVDGNYDVVGVYDDRPAVLINVWMDMQFKVYCCGNPYISF